MSDMMQVIQPKSDQINADDLIGGDLTITITEVIISGGQEQPVSMRFAGSQKFYRPCKSMCRVMVHIWGPDAKAYVGRSLQLYRDPSVKWGGMDVGGIRIRAMSHMDAPITMPLTATKGSRKLFTVKPLAMPNAQPAQQRQAQQPAQINPGLLNKANEIAARGTDALRAMWETELDGEEKAALKAEMPRLKAVAAEADRVRAENATFGLDLTPEQLAAEAAAHAEVAAQRAQEGDNA